MKKVFIGVLAALMLFAFTACEPSSLEYNTVGKDVSMVFVNQVKDILPDDTPEASDFEVVVYFTNGDAPETFEGKNLVTVTKTGDGSTTPVKYTAEATINQKTGKCVAEIAQPTAFVSLTPVAELTIKKGSSALASTPDAVIAYTYTSIDGTEKTAEYKMTGSSVGYTIDPNFTASEAEIDDVVAVTVKMGEDTVNLEATVVSADDPKTTITKVEAAFKEGTGILVGEKFTADAKKNVEFTATYADNHTGAVTPTAWDATQYKLENTAINGTMTFALKVTIDGKDYDSSITVTPVQDYATSWTVKLNDGVTYTEGTTVKVSDFTFTVASWASGKQIGENPGTTPYSQFKITNAEDALYVKHNSDKDQKLSVGFEYIGNEISSHAVTDPTVYEVTLNPTQA